MVGGENEMEVRFRLGGVCWRVDVARPRELGIALDFYGAQPEAYGMPKARAEAVRGGSFVGDRREGGSVNCERIELIAHGNGTHTEGVGHLTKERIYVGDLAGELFVPATLLTVESVRLGGSKEHYQGEFQPEDDVITAEGLEGAWVAAGGRIEFARALVIRLERKKGVFEGPKEKHSGRNRPYFTSPAMEWIRRSGCDHLLVELPSVDREEDGGRLPNHHRFFGLEPDGEAGEESRRRTITEMIEVGADLRDGYYALSLRFPRFMQDAAPSRPVLYGLEGGGLEK